MDIIAKLARIMNKDAAETFDPSTDSLEAISNSITGTTITEVQSSNVATGAGSVATLTRLGSLVRWIADAVNNASSGLANLFALITGIKTNTDLILPGTKIIAKTSSSPLTTGTLFNVVGRVQILSITGKITTAIQNQATTVKLSFQADALGVEDWCATLDINAWVVGTLLGLSGTMTDVMMGTNGHASKSGMTPITAVVVTGGTISVTYGAASTGVIVWDCLWIPISTNGSVTPA